MFQSDSNFRARLISISRRKLSILSATSKKFWEEAVASAFRGSVLLDNSSEREGYRQRALHNLAEILFYAGKDHSAETTTQQQKRYALAAVRCEELLELIKGDIGLQTTENLVQAESGKDYLATRYEKMRDLLRLWQPTENQPDNPKAMQLRANAITDLSNSIIESPTFSEALSALATRLSASHTNESQSRKAPSHQRAVTQKLSDWFKIHDEKPNKRLCIDTVKAVLITLNPDLSLVDDPLR